MASRVATLYWEKGFKKSAIFCLGIATEISVWEGVVVSPLEKAYEKPADVKKEDDDMETEEN